MCICLVHFIIMITNRKELNGERNKSIKIDLAGPQWVRERVREGRAGEEGRNGYWRGSETVEEGKPFSRRVLLLRAISLPSTNENQLNTRSILLPVSVLHVHTVSSCILIHSGRTRLTQTLIWIYYYSPSGRSVQPAL